MGGKCDTGQHWDPLVRICRSCKTICNSSHFTFGKCKSYCETTNCNAQPGHFYDALLKKCMTCEEVCGRHPPECSQHCQVPSTALTTTQAPVKGLVPISRGLPVPAIFMTPTIALYSLLALCLVLLLSSLTLALVILLRLIRAKNLNLKPRKAKNNQQCVVQLGQEVGAPGIKRSKDFAAKQTHEPSDDSTPTETCVCVHCFPDLKALGQSNSRPVRTTVPIYQQDALHRAPIQKGGSTWTGGNLYPSVVEVQEEACGGMRLMTNESLDRLKTVSMSL